MRVPVRRRKNKKLSWIAVNRDNPCPMCGGPDNCKVSTDGRKAWCGRKKSKIRNKGGQCLHSIPVAHRTVRQEQQRTFASPPVDWHKLAMGFAHEARRGRRRMLATDLGVTPKILNRLNVGWCGISWTIPERDGSGKTVGIGRRFEDGRKGFLQGGNHGLIYIDDWDEGEGPILIVEGFSDVAMGLHKGLCVIGRPMAYGGVDDLAELFKDLPDNRKLIVLGEWDQKPNGDWPGRDAAVSVSEQLASILGREVAWALPPNEEKDLRTWFTDREGDAEEFLDRLELIAVDPLETESTDDVMKGNEATKLVKLAVASRIELSHSADGVGHASIQVDGHRETHAVNGKHFYCWLRRLAWEQLHKAVNQTVMSDAISTLDGMAIHDGECVETAVRIAEFEGAVYIDLGDEYWRVIEVTPECWTIVENPPVRFVRRGGMRPLPVPVHGGKLSEFREFLNVGSDDVWTLFQAWLLGCFRPSGPYPVLALYGEQGTAKSTTCRLLRELIDPNKASIRSAPSSERDLAIAASNSWVVAFDNISFIRDWLSDALCRIATGGGLATRQLYADAEETIFDVQRPVIINGIADLARRSDLADRTIALTLQQIPDDQRKTEADLWDRFRDAHPRILGAILTAVSMALKNEADVTIDVLPRMADFSRWVVAGESELDCRPGGFLKAYAANRAALNEFALSSSIIGEPLLKLMEKRESWSGTATELLDQLAKTVTRSGEFLPAGWPRRPNFLSGQLRRITPNLRAIGWNVVLDMRTGRPRVKTIRIERIAPKEKKKIFVKVRRSPKKKSKKRPLRRPRTD